MDLPPFSYHHPRYAPNPLPPPPPPPATRFPDDPTFYQSHHNHHQFPPPPPPPSTPQTSLSRPPPPPPPSYLPLPPPPPLPHNTHRLQFTFRNINPTHPIDDFPHSDHRRPPRNHHRLPQFDYPCPETRPDSWDSSRVILDHRPARPFPDREAHHGSIDLKPMSPYRGIDKFRHDPEGSSRFREELSDGFEQNRREEFVWGRNESRGDRRGHFVSNSDRNYRNFGTVSNHSSSSREFESKSTGFDNRFDNELYRNGRGYDTSENQRWDRNRQILRDMRDSMIEMGNNEIVDGDNGARVFPGKREYYGSELGRYSNRESRENSHEPNRGTPRKQVQKKSAFLRIQMAKPNNRNREDDRLHYSGYFDESNSSSYRGKDQVVYSGHGMEEEREGSPVELDVSFKSNSLVAKAIVFPSRSTVESDKNSTPRDSKIRKVMMSDRECSGSQLNKLDEGNVKLESSTHGRNNASGSSNDSKQLEQKVRAPGTGNVGDISSQPGSNGTDVSHGKSKVESSLKGTISDKGGNSDGSGKTSIKVAKKKKVVKKIVKRVLIPRSRLLSSQPMKKPVEPVKADSSAHIPPAAHGSDKGVTHLEEKITSSDMGVVHDVDLPLCPDEVNVLPENNQVDGSPKAMVSEEGGADVDSGRACVTEINRESNCSFSPLCLPSREETKIDEGPVNADNSVHDLCTISNSDKDLTISLNETILSDIGSADVSKQVCQNESLCQNEDSLSVESGTEKESPEAIYSEGGNVNSGLLSVEIHDSLVNTCSSASMTNTYLGFDNGLSQEKITVSDICPVDAINKEPCTDQVTTSLEDSILEGHILGSNDDCTNLEEITVPNSGTGVDIGKQPSPIRVTVSLENGAIEGSPYCMVSAKGTKEDTPIIKKKRKARSPQLDFSTSRITDIDVGHVNVVGPRHVVDTTLSLSVKDSSPAEVTASGIRSLGFGSQYTDGGNHLHGNCSTDGFSEGKVSVSSGVNVGPDETSLKYKKGKLFVPLPGSSSQMTFEINDGPVIADIPTSGAEVPSTPNDFLTYSQQVPSTSNNGLTQQEDKVVLSSMDSLHTAGLLPCQKGITGLFEDSLARGSFGPAGSVGDAFGDNGLKVEHLRFDSCSNVQESNIPNAQSLCPSGLEGEQKDNTAPVNEHQVDIMDIESSRGERLDVYVAEDQVMIHSETAQCIIPLEHQSPEWDQRLPSTDMKSDSYLLVKDDVPPVSNYQSLSADANGVCTTSSNDELMESLPDTLSNMCSPETFSDVPGIHMLSFEASLNEMSNEKGCEDNNKLDEKPAVESGSDSIAGSSFAQYTKVKWKPDNARKGDHSVSGKTVPLPLQDTKNITQNLNLASGESSGRKNQPNYAAPRIFPGRSSFVSTTSKTTAPSTHIAKPRTWHRTGNSFAAPLPGKKPFPATVPLQRQLPKKIGKVQSTSYIRKGNSLVRKPAPVAAPRQGSHGASPSVYRLKSTAIDEVKKSTGSDSRVEVIDPPNFLSTGGSIAPFERPKTPPLPNSTKFPNCTTNSSGDCTSSPLAEPLFSGCSETTSDPMIFAENNDAPKFSEDALKISETPENQAGPINNMDSQSEPSGGNLVFSNMKSIIYVKRKSNQLVAASKPRDLSLDNADKTRALSSDGYYKRRKNQLIRASLESHIKQTVALPDDSSNSEGQRVPKVISSRISSKRRPDKGKTSKRSKFSLVWTLHDTQSSRKDGDSLRRQKVLPHLFPWKRATYWRTCFPNSGSISNNRSLSMISKKLLLSRKRAAVYTRSTHGLSLRKSKVLSVGGSSLKWSKSIERHSKKANEEATLAVVAAEREKREQNGATCVISGTKSRNHSSHKSVNSVELCAGERIFRIGSFRYKMDSSKRTLQRISDDESSCSAALQSEKVAKRSYVPRRLVIGNDEYVRIGNGNQLIRDPKKRTRLLASEKVRWSLHTARLRSARKWKYCQFFTRFGKCNKDDGKCPYIHDPTKIAVCTKFLKGLCSNSNCNLTHKVIPERMPDCSYFLQGLCSNESCPYRHVNVNPSASTCEGFLRGYCADGNECRKKHSYVCPIFEATGVCPQGSKCKLHHPKNRSKEKKRKRSRERKNAQGRYFGSMHINVSKPGTVVSEKHSAQNNDDIFFDGRLADYISLDASDEEAGENNDLASDPTILCDINDSDTELDDLDKLIKPIRIMNNNDDIFISASGSSSEKSASYTGGILSDVKEVMQLGILFSKLAE